MERIGLYISSSFEMAEHYIFALSTLEFQDAIKIRYKVAMKYTIAKVASRQTIPGHAAPVINAMIKRWSSLESLALFEKHLGVAYAFRH